MSSMKRTVALAAFVVSGLALTHAQGPADWYNVGFDAGGSKYSPLTQITPANVANLTTAWTYDKPCTGKQAFSASTTLARSA